MKRTCLVLLSFALIFFTLIGCENNEADISHGSDMLLDNRSTAVTEDNVVTTSSEPPADAEPPSGIPSSPETVKPEDISPQNLSSPSETSVPDDELPFNHENTEISIENMFDANPIDSFFNDIAQIIQFSTTVDMFEFGYIACAAWEAEMLNCYEVLKSLVSDSRVLEFIENDKNTYIEYVEANVELTIVTLVSDAFSGVETMSVGSLSLVLRPSLLSEGYKAKTVDLFKILYDIGETPQFIFSEDVYGKQLREVFPECNLLAYRFPS